MVRVLAAQVIDVQSHQRMVDEALEKFMRQIDIESTDHRALERHVKFESWAAGKIDDDARQRLVQRHIGVPVTANALLVADRFRKCLAERDADIFHGVVRVDMQITLGFDVEIDQPMARDLITTRICVSLVLRVTSATRGVGMLSGYKKL